MALSLSRLGSTYASSRELSLDECGTKNKAGALSKASRMRLEKEEGETLTQDPSPPCRSRALSTPAGRGDTPFAPLGEDLAMPESLLKDATCNPSDLPGQGSWWSPHSPASMGSQIP